ncbi:MAG: amino acid ABC transporter permease [Actinomycetota bacterium]|nr:amino acid ABC transporter permease [Actinomycetota bacterium]
MSELWEILRRFFPEFAAGFLVTCQIVGIAFLVAMVVGTLVASLRIAPVKVLNWIGGLYVETFRNIPLLVLLFISYAGFRRGGFPIAPMVAATGSLGLYTAAYVAEAIRSGVFAVGRGQIEAALSLGFSYPATMRKIILPQAIRTVIPPIGNLTIAMIKNSAIVGVSLALADDLMKQARLINSSTFKTNETFFWAGVGYLLLTVTATFIVRHLETRLTIKR